MALPDEDYNIEDDLQSESSDYDMDIIKPKKKKRGRGRPRKNPRAPPPKKKAKKKKIFIQQYDDDYTDDDDINNNDSSESEYQETSDDDDEKTESESESSSNSKSENDDSSSTDDDTSDEEEEEEEEEEDDDDDDEEEEEESEDDQLTEEEYLKLMKQKKIAAAQKDLEKMHDKLRKIIEDKLNEKRNNRKKNNNKNRVRNRRYCSTDDDNEFIQQYNDDDIDDDGSGSGSGGNSGSSGGLIDVLTEQPSVLSTVHGKLRKYQLDGLNWLIRVQETGLNAILADEMGLGKTLQSISLLAYNLEYNNISGKHLIIVPKTTIYTWRNEFSRWCPDGFKILLLDGNKHERKELINKYIVDKIKSFDICITSYEQCNIEQLYLNKINWFYIIVDEAHRMKNENAKLSQTCRLFESKHRLLLTGTPLQNNLHELWSLLNFLQPKAFDNANSFDILFDLQQNIQQQQQLQSNNNNNNNNNTSSSNSNNSSVIVNDDDIKYINRMLSAIHKLLRPLMLRRYKDDVEKSLPSKTEMILYVGMSKLQVVLYKSILSNKISILKDTIKSKKALLNTAMQLRKVCNHPYLFDNVEDRRLSPHGQHVILNSAKLCMLDKLLPKLYSSGSKCLIFCQMTRMLDILDDYCTIRKYNRCRIDGNTAGIDRESQIHEFNNNNQNTKKFIFLLSTRAGGLGINLVSADCVIFYDSDWNPQMDLQAQDRAHRIGQTKSVKIFRLITKNTIEERILRRAQNKLDLNEMVIDKSHKSHKIPKSKSKAPTKEEMSSMIKHGVDKIIKLKNESTINVSESIDDILKKGIDEFKKLKKVQNVNKFSISADDYKLTEDMNNLDDDVFRILAKIRKQNSLNGDDIKKKIGGRTTNNSSNGYIKIGEMNDKLPLLNDRHGHASHMLSASASRYTRMNNLEAPEKAPIMQHFQFYEKDKLLPLYEKQWYWYNLYKNMKQIDIPQLNYDRYGLDCAEYKLKQKLIAESFGKWNYKHFWAFIKCQTDYGRENIDKLCESLAHFKCFTRDDIILYSRAFWENRFNNEEIFKKHREIIVGEIKIERYIEYNKLLTSKMSLYRHPLIQMEFKCAPYDNSAHGWRIEHDRFIIYSSNKIGYGNWNKLRQSLINEPKFRFDYFVQSRSNNDINKRMRQLRPSIEKECGIHIRIFDRKTNPAEIKLKNIKIKNRKIKHLKYLNDECAKINNKKIIKQENNKRKLILPTYTPPAKKRKLNIELPTPPPPSNIVITNISDNNNNNNNSVYI